jgi:hypothetical protein
MSIEIAAYWFCYRLQSLGDARAWCANSVNVSDDEPRRNKFLHSHPPSPDTADTRHPVPSSEREASFPGYLIRLADQQLAAKIIRSEQQPILGLVLAAPERPLGDHGVDFERVVNELGHQKVHRHAAERILLIVGEACSVSRGK